MLAAEITVQSPKRMVSLYGLRYRLHGLDWTESIGLWCSPPALNLLTWTFIEGLLFVCFVFNQNEKCALERNHNNPTIRWNCNVRTCSDKKKIIRFSQKRVNRKRTVPHPTQTRKDTVTLKKNRECRIKKFVSEISVKRPPLKSRSQAPPKLGLVTKDSHCKISHFYNFGLALSAITSCQAPVLEV